MNNDWISSNTIYTTIHGSQCYGLANEFSDIDLKGIVIPPSEVEYNIFSSFTQVDNAKHLDERFSYLKNPKNPKLESTLFSLRKFFTLAAEVNPNIIEILYTDPKHHLIKHPIMEELLDKKDLFLSNKARYTFAGYAVAQAKKIERHRKWIVLGEVKPPIRSDFSLPEAPVRGLDEIFGYIKSKVEQWNLNQYSMDELQRSELKNTIWELITNVTESEISVANWPDKYAVGVIDKLKHDYNLSDDLIRYIHSERSYVKAKQVYDSWVSWKRERNPERRKLEEKCGFDSKHASHLVRLMKMGYEIITSGKVIVNRTGIDADELLDVKNGVWSFDKVMEFKEDMEKKLTAEYIKFKSLVSEGKPTPIPHEVNKNKINELYFSLYDKYQKS